MKNLTEKQIKTAKEILAQHPDKKVVFVIVDGAHMYFELSNAMAGTSIDKIEPVFASKEAEEAWVKENEELVKQLAQQQKASRKAAEDKAKEDEKKAAELKAQEEKAAADRAEAENKANVDADEKAKADANTKTPDAAKLKVNKK